MNVKILKAHDLDDLLTLADKNDVAMIDSLYQQAMLFFPGLEYGDELQRSEAKESLIRLFSDMEGKMQEICGNMPKIHVHSFLGTKENCSQVSRVMATLRDIKTGKHEFIYNIQRAFEILFDLAYRGEEGLEMNRFFIKTPVVNPAQNYAIHAFSNIDNKIDNSVMCVLLRGALLPSMVLSREIQKFSSQGYLTPFALFKIKRDDTKNEHNMEYIFNLDHSFFDLEMLNGKDLIFADPMNATGGSFITVVKFLLDSGVKPKSIKIFNVVSALKGALRIIRAIENCEIYTLWLDPALNEKAYIMPGLGDAGDRINGKADELFPNNIIQLIAHYGRNIAGLYPSQLWEIENTLLKTKL
ncbi:MAG: uracil phosphoribosyltransferase [Treponema sp.]|nr:uracil phosphoribosyltransferase [Treponema sp.]